MVEPQPSKLAMPVRSRSPAPATFGRFRGRPPDSIYSLCSIRRKVFPLAISTYFVAKLNQPSIAVLASRDRTNRFGSTYFFAHYFAKKVTRSSVYSIHSYRREFSALTTLAASRDRTKGSAGLFVLEIVDLIDATNMALIVSKRCF